MKKLLLLFLLLFLSILVSAQTKCTLNVTKYGLSAKPGFLKNGIHINLPEYEYRFYIFSERIILGIEEFDTISKFRERENELTLSYQHRMCKKMGEKNESCADSYVAYEIENSPMFGSCRVIYFYYDSSISTNSIINSWSSIGDGDYTIVIIKEDIVYYTRKIKVRKGNLVN